jgi:hypothetical protein
MNRSRVRIALTLLALGASLIVASVALAGPTVPHKESADGQLTLQINPTQTSLGTMKWVAQGNATQMGKYSQVGSHNFSAPNAQGQGLVLNGLFTSTAADGSTISGTYSGTYTLLGNNQIRFNVTAYWLTGTGRLAGITGQAPVVALMNATTGAFHYEDSGYWTFP